MYVSYFNPIKNYGGSTTGLISMVTRMGGLLNVQDVERFKLRLREGSFPNERAIQAHRPTNINESNGYTNAKARF